jgi:hypothetical protein
MISLVSDHLEEIRSFCRSKAVRRLDLFGSSATDEFEPDRSDIDFLVEFKNENLQQETNQFFELMSQLEELLGRPVDLVEEAAIRNPYIKQAIDRERVQIYAS